MPATRYELNHVEKVIRGGVGTLFLTRRSPSPTGAHIEIPQALTSSQQPTRGDGDVREASPEVIYESAACTGEGSVL